MRLLALLLLAVAAGFLLGRLTAPERGGARGQRAPAPAAPEPRAPAQSAPPEPAPAERPATPGVVEPAGPIVRDEEDQSRFIDGPDDEYGVIEVDFEGFDGDTTAWAGWRQMRGGYEAWDAWPEEGESVATLNLAPGTYDVWWMGPDGRRRGTRAAVEAGKRTLIRAVEYRSAGPVPEGLGVLEVEVAASWGGGLSCVLRLLRAGERDAVEVNAGGHGTATLFPGRYVLQIGDRRDEVAIAEGRVTSHRIEHAREGDLILDDGGAVHAGAPHEIGVARPGERFERLEVWTGFGPGGDLCSGFPYLAEGPYDLYLVRGHTDSLAAPLGRAVVHAGRATLFRYELPKGGVSARVTWPDLRIRGRAVVTIHPVVDGVRSEDCMQLNGADDSHEASLSAVLAPGRYVVVAEAPYCERKEVEVDVADRMVDLAFDLVQDRGR